MKNTKIQKLLLFLLVLSLTLFTACKSNSKIEDIKEDEKEEQAIDETKEKDNEKSEVVKEDKKEESKKELKKEELKEGKSEDKNKNKEEKKNIVKKEEREKKDIVKEESKKVVKKEEKKEEKKLEIKTEKKEAPKVEKKSNTVSFTISSKTLLNNMDKLDKNKHSLVPENGIIYSGEVEVKDGESVFDVLSRVTRNEKIHLESSFVPLYKTSYIEGINNLYEFDAGELSGWMYSVNGEFPNYGSSEIKIKAGDTILWEYTCNLGEDIGGRNTLSE